jgi:hypothetical protein
MVLQHFCHLSVMRERREVAVAKANFVKVTLCLIGSGERFDRRLQLSAGHSRGLNMVD